MNKKNQIEQQNTNGKTRDLAKFYQYCIKYKWPKYTNQWAHISKKG